MLRVTVRQACGELRGEIQAQRPGQPGPGVAFIGWLRCPTPRCHFLGLGEGLQRLLVLGANQPARNCHPAVMFDSQENAGDLHRSRASP